MKYPIVLLISFCFLFSPSLYAAERVALVISNANYKHLKDLKNPLNDAKAVAKRLTGLGFTLIRPIRKNSDVQYDLTEDELITARNALLNKADGAELAFIYYSGHGASLGNRLDAHILPINISAPTQSKTSLELLKRHALSLDSLLNGLDQKATLTIAVFDACREIPELEKTKSIFGNNSQWRGLGRVRKGRKRIIAYSGAQGQVVADGDGRYSPYTQRLLDVLDEKPSLEIGNLFREVATRVESYTNQTAEVLIQSVPPNRFYLKEKSKVSITGKKIKHYIAYDNGTALDTKRNLLWMRCSVGQTWTGSNCSGEEERFSWDDAMKFTSNFAGYSDWRLPTIEELRLLVYCRNSQTITFNPGKFGCEFTNDELNDELPTILRSVFPNNTIRWYWSSSSYDYGSTNAWSVNFLTGIDLANGKNYPQLVRLVRSGQ